MSRPKLEIPLKPIDRFLDLTALLGLIILIVFPIMEFSNLPDKIPSHFDAWGTPDNYQGKNFIWTLPALGTFLFILFHLIKKIPHKFNYLVEITQENAREQYTIAVRLIRTLNCIIMLAFAYITWTTIQVALKNSIGLGTGFPLLFLLLVLGIVFSSIFFSTRKK